MARQPANDAARVLRGIHSQLVTAGGAYPQPMLIDQLGALSRMAGSADMKVGRSAFEYLAELKTRLKELQSDLARVSKQ
jgi:hypothetical protein